MSTQVHLTSRFAQPNMRFVAAGFCVSTHTIVLRRACFWHWLKGQGFNLYARLCRARGTRLCRGAQSGGNTTRIHGGYVLLLVLSRRCMPWKMLTNVFTSVLTSLVSRKMYLSVPRSAGDVVLREYVVPHRMV